MAGLKFIGHRQTERDSEILGMHTLDRRLYLDNDDNVVEEGDERAAFLLGAKGTEIPMHDAVKLGLVDPHEAAAKIADKLKPEDKAKQKPEDKKAAKPEDNAVRIREDKGR